MARIEGERTPGFKLLLAILIGLALSIPLFSVWLLVYDRQSQSNEARASITEKSGIARATPMRMASSSFLPGDFCPSEANIT